MFDSRIDKKKPPNPFYFFSAYMTKSDGFFVILIQNAADFAQVSR